MGLPFGSADDFADGSCAPDNPQIFAHFGLAVMCGANLNNLRGFIKFDNSLYA
jgi:hypothetical protein